MAKKLISFLTLIAGVGLYGCSNLDSSVEKPPAGAAQISRASVPGSESSPSPSPALSCTRPDIFNLPKNAVALDPSALSKSLSGDYNLQSAQIYQEVLDSSEKPGAVILVNFAEASKQQNQSDGNGTDTLQTACPDSSNPKYSFEAVLPMVDVIHFPSGRVTIFDSGSNMDTESFNYPSLVNLTVDVTASKSNLSVIHAIPEAPYTSNKTLGEWLNSLPAKPQADVTADGVLELWLNWVTQNAQGVSKTQAYLRYSK